jgi:hypothetical protein
MTYVGVKKIWPGQPLERRRGRNEKGGEDITPNFKQASRVAR